jgi:sulfatase maturation enzyme AslB (radical SAM superfamily)
MKPITIKEKLPKFLVVNDDLEKKSYNKYFIKPFKKGEIVKVASFEEQVRSGNYDNLLKYFKPNNDQINFMSNFVVVYRKDDEGKFNLKYTESWKSFDLLTKIKK